LAGRFQEFIHRMLQNFSPAIQDQVNSYFSNLLITINGAISRDFLPLSSFISATLGLILGFSALPCFSFIFKGR